MDVSSAVSRKHIAAEDIGRRLVTTVVDLLEESQIDLRQVTLDEMKCLVALAARNRKLRDRLARESLSSIG